MRRWGEETRVLCGQGDVGKVEEWGQECRKTAKNNSARHIAAKDLGQAVSDSGTAEQAKEQVRRRPRDELDKPDSTGWHAEALKR